jgi:TfuA protein
VVYLGPSLPLEEARTILDADYRPPVKRGDLATIPDRTEIVGIIDGVLLNDAAVGHREILALLDRGIKVLGASSMGALRAAELSDFGMIGVGQIYEEYASGRVEGDDEVVLSYDPYTLLPLSEPLINIRMNLLIARDRGVISPETETALMAEMKKVFYPRRNYSLLIEFAETLSEKKEAQRLKIFLRDGVEDFKQKDAKILLKAVNNLL